jgi:hypothetical protein
VKDVDKWADLEVTEQGVAKVSVAVDLVAVAATVLGPLEVPVGDQVGNDPLSGTFGDPDSLGDVARPGVGVAGDAEQRVSVVSEKKPARCSVRGLIHLRSPDRDSSSATLDTR